MIRSQYPRHRRQIDRHHQTFIQKFFGTSWIQYAMKILFDASIRWRLVRLVDFIYQNERVGDFIFDDGFYSE